MSNYSFRCFCKAELQADGPAADVALVYEAWQAHHLNHTSANSDIKTKEALYARRLLEAGKPLRKIARELGYNHPQSVKFLIERYAPIVEPTK